MGLGSVDTASPDVVAHGLRDIRARRRRYWLASALGVPAFVALGAVWSTFSSPPRWAGYLASLALGIAWLSLANRLERRVWMVACPRCGELFHARRWGPFELRGVFLRSCQHCGLHLRADRHLRA